MPGSKSAGDTERFIWHEGEATLGRVNSQCRWCLHFQPGTISRCDAFPDSIPGDIYHNELDHRQPYEADHGIRWEPKKMGMKHPLDQENQP